MDKKSLSASPRQVFGRKTKQLRKAGKLPATIYGKGIKSSSIEVSADDFNELYSDSGEVGLLEIRVGDKKSPVLVHNVQRHPVTGEVLHIEFLQVSLKEKITTSIQITVVGESEAVKSGVGVLLQHADSIDIETLPTNIPEGVEVDISSLSEVGMDITAGSLSLPEGVTLVTDPETSLVRITEPAKEEPEEDQTDSEEEGVGDEEEKTDDEESQKNEPEKNEDPSE